MAKLVVLSAGLAGRSHELNVDKTTIGRVEDNTFQIAEASISSHHCEILLRGTDVVVKDLNSTNGTFINGEKVSETVLKPGQILRLGQIEIRLEDGASSAPVPVPAAASAPASAAPPGAGSAGKKLADSTMLMQRGVSLSELEQGPRTSGFDTKAFSKKNNKANRWIFITAGVVLVVIVFVLLYAFAQVNRR